MSYDLFLYLKSLPEIGPAQFTEVCEACGLTVEPSPDFTVDGSITPLCCKLSGFLGGDDRFYLGVVDYDRLQTTEALHIELPGPKKKWWQFKKPKGESVEIPTGSECLFFSCGMDALEIPMALLVACALAGEEGILVDPQLGSKGVAIGQTAITARLIDALEQLEQTPSDRLLLHPFEGWL